MKYEVVYKDGKTFQGVLPYPDINMAAALSEQTNKRALMPGDKVVMFNTTFLYGGQYNDMRIWCEEPAQTTTEVSQATTARGQQTEVLPPPPPITPTLQRPQAPQTPIAPTPAPPVQIDNQTKVYQRKKPSINNAPPPSVKSSTKSSSVPQVPTTMVNTQDETVELTKSQSNSAILSWVASAASGSGSAA